ncbi:HNH endonuclease [Frankia sp. EI5c]|uniref:HNH endonuclease n=1 Tax=Frankia sp. EI5c TaxID=683316 RepID=UPI0007C25FB3|nr:HNH endonuclease [Frankia sp. EI5c]OAA23586.1 HNH endonuclease [Frankia sp. EI5c]
MSTTPGRATRERLLQTWNHQCAYCGGRADHLDHVIPRSHGGAHREDNRLPACQMCGQAKGARTLAQWLADIATTGSRTARPGAPQTAA